MNAVSRYLSTAISETGKKTKVKQRPKVTRKARFLKTPDGRLKIKELPQLLQLIEKDHLRYEGFESKMIEKSLSKELNEDEMSDALDKEEQTEISRTLSQQEKVAEISKRYRKELKESAIKKCRIEGKLLSVHIRYVLQGYLHACVNSNNMEKAHQALIWYRHKLRNINHSKENVVDVSVYNIVLKGWSLSGKLNRVQEILRLMKSSKVMPDMQSFAYYLLCLVKQPEINENAIKEVLKHMKSRNWDPNRLFTDSKLNEKNRALLMENLLSIDDTLNFVKPEYVDGYDVHLMSDFSEDSRVPYLPFDELQLIDFSKAFDEQKTAEQEGIIRIKAVHTNNTSVSHEEAEHYKSCWKKVESSWRKSFTEAFNRDLKVLKNKFSAHHGMNIVPYLTALEPSVFVDIMVNEMHFLGRNINFSPPISYLRAGIGKRVRNYYLTQLYTSNCTEIEQLFHAYLDYYKNPDLVAKCSPRKLIQEMSTENDLYLNNDISEMALTPPALMAIGKFLYDIILNEAKIDVNIVKKNAKKSKIVPVFNSVYVTRDMKTQEELWANPHFSKLYQLANLDELMFDSNELPMCVPPFPWISHERGGYLYAKTDFVRDPGTGEGLLGIKLTENSNLNAIHDALNVLSFCPWKINERVLDVVTEVFRNNGDLKLEIPLHPSALSPLPKLDEAKTAMDRALLLKQRNIMKQKHSEMYSLWCDCLYKLSIANHFRKKVFWFPQNLDFRGRVYAVPPHLNHLGGDVSRSLLLFAKGKPLGPKGLDWLKIHLINLTGTKKRNSIEERLDYANEIMPLILDSADNPLEGKKWWMNSDEPWQTLACCMEVAKASRSKNPEEYICYFPVHQDGSCNGLQHYAALGRDEEGAVSVNLHPDEKPNDVYSTVASFVENARQQDASQLPAAKVVEGFINRKVVKQTVMTYVYGVTRYGARLQILKRLKDIDGFPEEQLWGSAGYLTQKTFDSIQQMFTATRKIQDWFTSCARSISFLLGLPVEWVTPLGFPVVQPYFKKTEKKKKDHLEVLPANSEATTWKPNVMKQKNAFPPNFIHSLDSTHMMLTALHCEQKGITFAAVHDSYWTHPSTINEMNKICREQFVALHSEPILSNLSEYMVSKYEPILKTMFDDVEAYEQNLQLFKSVPETGKFDLRNVLKSVYFFS